MPPREKDDTSRRMGHGACKRDVRGTAVLDPVNPSNPGCALNHRGNGRMPVSGTKGSNLLPPEMCLMAVAAAVAIPEA